MTSSSSVQTSGATQSPSLMMAWRVHEFGPPDVMRFEQVPRPILVLVRLLSRLKPLGWDLGTAGLEPGRALYPSRSL